MKLARSRGRTAKSSRVPVRMRTVRKLPAVRFWREAYIELRKAHWPNREQTARLTAMVVAISMLMAMVLGLSDLLFAELFKLLAA